MTTATPTLDAMRARLAELTISTERIRALLCEDSRKECHTLSSLMARFIVPRPNDVREQSWSTLAQARVDGLASAIEALDIVEALKHGRLVEIGREAHFYVKMFFRLVAETCELAGLREVLEWLQEAEDLVTTIKAPLQMVEHLAAMGIDPCDDCHCDLNIDDGFSYPSLRWLHAHHAEFNQAMWEILNSVPRLMDGMHEVLMADIGTGQPELVSNVEFGLKVTQFLTSSPSPAWVGDAYVPAAA